MSVSKRTRFEVFKRDCFVCQYCGSVPPKVILEIDHVIPRALNGTDDINNLVTSCFDCNRGKSDVPLDKIPPTLSEKLKHLKEKQLQTKKYYQYLEKLESIKQETLEDIGKHFFNLFSEPEKKNAYTFAGNWELSIANFLKTFNKFEIIEAIDIAFVRLSRRHRYGKPLKDSVFRYTCGILHNWKKDRNL